LRIDDVFIGGRVRDRAIVIQKKAHRPVQFEITEQTRTAIDDRLTVPDERPEGLESHRPGEGRRTTAISASWLPRATRRWCSSVVGIDR
jgi:hypothetical protein